MTDGVRLSELQRARMLSAMTVAACERGAGNVTASDVVAKAGVSRRTFYELFSSCEECLLAAIDDAIGQVAEHVRPAYEAAGGWQEKIRDGLAAMLDFFDDQPTIARLLIVETFAAGPQARARRNTALSVLAGTVDKGRYAGGRRTGRESSASREKSESSGGRVSGLEGGPPALTGSTVVGGVLSVLYEQLSVPPAEPAKRRQPAAEGGRRVADRGRHAVQAGEPLAVLAPELAGLIVLPYLGPAACRDELQRPLAKPGKQPDTACGEHDAAHRLVKDSALRLTTRTILMLAAVAQHPGSSNRMLAEQVGVHDQGQASKLLLRLQTRGLVENTASGSPRGTPNSWRLTSRGRQLHELARSCARGDGRWGL